MWHVSLKRQELLSLPDHLNFSGVHIVHSFVFVFSFICISVVFRFVRALESFDFAVLAGPSVQI